MTTTMPDLMGTNAFHEPLSIFYLRAEDEDGNNLDLAVLAEHETAGVDLWFHHFFDDTDSVAERWATEGMGIMTLAMPDDLDQRDLEPGPIDWALEPFRYPTP